MNNYETMIAELLSNPEKLKKKKPFTRGYDITSLREVNRVVGVNEFLDAILPSCKQEVITQDEYLMELDPNSHSVLYDDNIPSICMKTKDGGYIDIHYQKMAMPFQQNIKNKQLLHLTGNPLVFTLIGTNPTKKQSADFITFKQYWEMRNQDGMKNKMVDKQLSVGDAGLLYYYDYKGRIKSRILSYPEYVLCPHNDQNGDRILESVYYIKDNVEYIDSYGETYMYRHKKSIVVETENENGWVMEEPKAHGFSEIPLITKRGQVAWDKVQSIITCYEVLYNVFMAIQRRHGWGLLYIKGKFQDKAQKIAGSVILNDTSIDGKGDAKFLTPPSPEGIIETLQQMLDSIQLGSSTTFILPKDLKTGGDLAGITVQLVQNLDIQAALQNVIDWQNVADKMVRLFKEGLSKELVNKKLNKTALTDFSNLNISAKFKVWRPMNDYEYNQMLTILTGAGILSKETGIEKNTESAPDELVRLKNQETLAMEQQQQLLDSQKTLNSNNNKMNGGDSDGGNAKSE